LAEGLDATETRFFQREGRVTDSRELVSYPNVERIWSYLCVSKISFHHYRGLKTFTAIDRCNSMSCTSTQMASRRKDRPININRRHNQNSRRSPTDDAEAKTSYRVRSFQKKERTAKRQTRKRKPYVFVNHDVDAVSSLVEGNCFEKEKENLMTGIDIQIANLKNKITAKKLQLEHRVAILTERVRDAEERERLESKISELTAAKQELERQVSALDLEQRKAAAAEESRKMSLERAAASGEFE
jgi:hypothetical protein